jgi:hypothetical protein
MTEAAALIACQFSCAVADGFNAEKPESPPTAQ